MTDRTDGSASDGPDSDGPDSDGPDSERLAADTEQSARETARLRATELRSAQRKLDRRRRMLVRGGIVFGVVSIIVIVALVLVTVTRPSGRGPQNMQSDGIVLGKDLKAVRTEALRSTDDPVPTRARAGVVAIRLYIDFFQPDSAAFLSANSAQLRQYLDSGAATLEIHPIAIATTGTDGAQYSLRAANAAGCVAELDPDRFFAFTRVLLDRQPDPKSSGLDDARIVQAARTAGVSPLKEVRRCVETERFGRWVQAATQRATAGPLPGAGVRRVRATPTVLLDGQEYRGNPGSAREFGRAFVSAVGDSFAEDATATPAPTSSATPTP
ncbi:MAG: thioredoxin domain-containing protein [Micrococcales bacterium]|nr:thioredoxin domain-containing protein [Micrococcales bacterium]